MHFPISYNASTQFQNTSMYPVWSKIEPTFPGSLLLKAEAQAYFPKSLMKKPPCFLLAAHSTCAYLPQLSFWRGSPDVSFLQI